MILMYPISLSCRFSFWPWAFQEQWGSSHRAAQFLAFEWCRAGAARHPKSFATCIIELQSLGSLAKWIDSSWEPGHLRKNTLGQRNEVDVEELRSYYDSTYMAQSCFIFFMQDQRLNQFIEWRLSMYIIADPKMKKPTKCLSQAFTRGWSDAFDLWDGVTWQRSFDSVNALEGGVRRCGEPNQGIQVDLYVKDYKGKGCRKFDIICSGMLLWLEAVIKNRYFASICTYWYWQKYLTDVNAKPREMIRGIDWKVTVDGVIPKSYSSKGP